MLGIVAGFCLVVFLLNPYWAICLGFFIFMFAFFGGVYGIHPLLFVLMLVAGFVGFWLLVVLLERSEKKNNEKKSLSLAVKCYQLSMLSIGKAAELAGMSRVNFETYLSENKIPVSNLDCSDVPDDLEKLKT